tara:strand:- start:979 stop:2070 length:1092 start_codon:yes stop_codon:yes gene_type:complete
MGYVGLQPASAALTAADITDGIIGNADIASDAAIVLSKTALAAGTGITLSTNTLNLDAAQTGITSAYNTNLKVGRDSQNLIDFATTDNKIVLRVNNVDEVELVENALSPVTNDGVALGTTSLGWSDLHIGTGGVINWANGEMTITEGADVLTVAGGTFATAALTATSFAPTLDISLADDKKIIFGGGSDASIEYDENGTDQLRIAGAGVVIENDVEIADSKFIEFASAAGTPTTDNKVQGIVIEFLAAEAITQFDAVYVSTTTGRVGRALATNAAKMPVIGIAIEAQGSAGSSVRVLTHGVYRDDGGFGSDMTVGVDLYAPETSGTLTTTRPSDDGDFIQVIGVATGVRSAFINPSLDIIEHA